ncbi:MAG TPA: MBL fold metallo-hydrolase [Nocardioides sp.]|nr:MBL fold metallo-hydrolase [Nocardioides sp.]
MKRLGHYRSQRPVGEGSFHAARVWSRIGDAESSMTYVYDCGSQPKYRASLHREVDRYKAAVSRIDLLFLSHAHIDHVNGVERLCDGITVDTVVMPLLGPTERLMAFAHAFAQRSLRQQDLAFYQEFSSDPVATIGNLGVPRVIQVSGSLDDGLENTNDPPGDDILPVPQPPGLDDQLPEAWQLVGRGSVQGFEHDGTAVISMPDTVHFELPATRAVTPWVLVPHVDQPIRRRAAEFEHRLHRALKVTPGWLKRSLLDPDFIRDLVTKRRRLLAKCYTDAIQSRDLNLTSLSLYSGPARPDADPNGSVIRWGAGWSRDGWRRTHDRNGWTIPHPLRVGWLGTGDAALKQAIRREPFLAHFGRYAEGVRTLVLPHHGSVHNHSEKLLTELQPEICVAPADAFRNWQHPSPDVIAAVAQVAVPVHVASAPHTQLCEWVEILAR